MSGPMVTLATTGRFHYPELALGLERRGQLAAFYSGYPRFKLGLPLPAGRLRTFPWLQTPYMLLARAGSAWAMRGRPLARWAQIALDRHIARSLPDCDIYAALSGCGVASGAVARRRGIRFVCERGSPHIAWTERLLREESERWDLPFVPADPAMIERELVEYALADRIVVPSLYARDTFVAMGIPQDRLGVYRLPYRFDPAPPPIGPDGPFRVLFVGNLSLTKGLGYFLRALRRWDSPTARITLVGAQRPETPALMRSLAPPPFEHIPALEHRALMARMADSHVLVLPSVDEGYGLVVAEAMRAGCTIIVSRNCGAASLVDDGRTGFVVPARDADAIADRLARLEADRHLLATLREAALATALAWPDEAEVAGRWLTATSG